MTGLSEHNFPMHYVCTIEEANSLICENTHYWVCSCGCRETRNGCVQSRIDVCLQFASSPGSGTDLKEISRDEALSLIDEAKNNWLVARPFRNRADQLVTEGICFCCQDCCGYFLAPDEVCDKGKMVESTKLTDCVHCGECTQVCYFNARKLTNRKLIVDRRRCYGCGLCASACPVSCIEMVLRST